MVEPTGYTALDLIGFTDKGPYDPTANYVRNDLVHVGNSTWRCKIDDTTGITPTEGANWTIFIESATSLAGMDDVDLNTPKAGDGLVHNGNDWTNIPIVTQEQNRVTGVHQFLYNRVTSAQVVGGLTITPNTDGSFTVGAGTATSNAQLLVSGTGTGSWSQAEQKLPIGEYYATCEGGTAGIYLKVMVEENNQQKTVYGSGQESYVVSSAPSNLVALIQITSGTVVPTGGITLKPLLRLQSDSDKTITPYAKTNRELTEKVDELYGSTNNKTSYIRGYYQYSNTISNILTLIQNFLSDISITNDIGVIDVVIAGNTPWSVRGYCYSSKAFAVLTAMRYDGSCKLFYRSSNTDTIKDFTTT